MNKFSNGQIVKANKIIDGLRITCLGTVVEYSHEYERYAVRWNKFDHSMHSCGGRCEFGHGFWAYEDEISLVTMENA